MRSIAGACGALLLAHGLGGCMMETGEPADDSAALQALDRDLGTGAQGDDVRAVNAYLGRHGYFPNAELAREYPAWRPLVQAPPASSDVYDERTAEAIRELQRSSGLVQTGVVDAGTRAVLAQARCGVPDGITVAGGDEKFALDFAGLGKTAVNWGVTTSVPPNLAANAVDAAIATALSRWAGPTYHTFSKKSGAAFEADIRISFSTKRLNGDPFPANQYGETALHLNLIPSADVRLNAALVWSMASTTPTGAWDLESALAHELGHAIGLHHSSFGTAIMNGAAGANANRRNLIPDDHVAGLARALDWEQFDGESDDIAVSNFSIAQLIYVTGGAAAPGGRQIWRFENGVWTKMGTRGATRIAASQGTSTPWAVTDSGQILRWNTSSLSFDTIGGCAIDVGMGADQSVWIVGCSAKPDGFAIYKWNGSGWDADSQNQGAVRISVGPRTPGGNNVPWITTSSNKILRRTSTTTFNGVWELLPGKGQDIAVGPSGHAWLIGMGTGGGGFSIHVWNEQAGGGGGNPPALARRQWLTVPGSALNLAVNHQGYPFVVNKLRGAYWTR